MTSYARGNAFERRVKHALERDGYWCWQTRGSKSPADLIAIKAGQILLIQVKGGATKMSGTDWNTLAHLCRELRATPLVADRDGRRIRYRRITGLHVAHSRRWPAEVWTPDQLVA